MVIESGEFSLGNFQQTPSELTPCRAGDIVADGEKGGFKFLYAHGLERNMKTTLAQMLKWAAVVLVAIFPSKGLPQQLEQQWVPITNEPKKGEYLYRLGSLAKAGDPPISISFTATVVNNEGKAAATSEGNLRTFEVQVKCSEREMVIDGNESSVSDANTASNRLLKGFCGIRELGGHWFAIFHQAKLRIYYLIDADSVRRTDAPYAGGLAFRMLGGVIAPRGATNLFATSLVQAIATPCGGSTEFAIWDGDSEAYKPVNAKGTTPQLIAAHLVCSGYFPIAVRAEPLSEAKANEGMACPSPYSSETWTNCFGERINEQGIKYIGEWKDGNADGRGTRTGPDGLKYDGHWKNGKRHGMGTAIYPNGVAYVGEWSDDRSNGHGTLTGPGRTVEGEWLGGKLTGQATEAFTDGRKYVGEFRDGKKSGRGVLYRADGSIFRSGTWEDGKFLGSR